MYRDDRLKIVTENCTVAFRMDDGQVGAVRFTRFKDDVSNVDDTLIATLDSPLWTAMVGKKPGQKFEVRIAYKNQPLKIKKGVITEVQ